MIITKHGKKPEEKKTFSFICNYCGCEFIADKNEYCIVDSSNSGLNPLLNCGESCLICSCPECHRIIRKYIKSDMQND